MPRKTTAIIASLVLVVALFSIWMTVRPSSPVINQAPRIGAGEVLAGETAKAVRDQGRVVVIAVGDPSQRGAPADLRLKTFQKELRKHGSISLAPTEFILPDANVNESLPGCPSAVFGEQIKRHANAAAIVFLMGLPSWESVSSMVPQGGAPKIIVMDTPLVTLKKSQYSGYFASGILAALIIPRMDSSDGASVEPKTPREWFDREYQVFTPQNYESLPE